MVQEGIYFIMKEILLPFIISSIAGLSTLIGYLFIYIKPSKTSDFIGASLAFSMTMMMIISITDLIPEGFFYLKGEYNIILAILILSITMVAGYVLNRIIGKKINESKKEKGSLYKLGVLSMIALMLHNLPEGILTFLSSSIDIKIGLKYSIAIMLHNIPEGIAIAIPIYYSTRSKGKAFSNTLISGLSEPLGAVLAYVFLYKYMSNTLISIILLLTASVMISISINDIFKETEKYNKHSVTKGIILGIIIGFITFILT